MSTISSETPESIQAKINEENVKYQVELNKGSDSPLSARKLIRVKIKELTKMLERLIKIRK